MNRATHDETVIETERACLGAAILNDAAAADVLRVLRAIPEPFVHAPHNVILRAMRALGKGDGVLLVNALRDAGDLEAAGGPAYISDLAAAVPTSANAAEYARCVLRSYTRRDAARIGRALARAERLSREDLAGVMADLLQSPIFKWYANLNPQKATE